MVSSPTVEWLIDGGWVDFTAANYIYGNDKVTIDRTGTGWRARDASFSSSRCLFRLKNRTGVFNYRTPGSTYYGKIGVGTQVRVKHASDVRFWGEVAALRLGADQTGLDKWVDVECKGALGRWSVGTRPIKSPLYREMVSPPAPAAYWPLEESVAATVALSGLPLGTNMTITGNYNFGANDTLAGSNALPSPAVGASAVGVIRAQDYPAAYVLSSDLWSVHWVMNIPAAPAAEIVLMSWESSGTAARYEVTLTAAGLVKAKAYDSSGTELLSHVGASFTDPTTGGSAYGIWYKWTVYPTLVVNWLINVQWRAVDFAAAATETSGTFGGSVPSQPLGRIVCTGAGSSPFSVGHIGAVPSVVFAATAASGNVGEFAWSRIQRVCEENSVSLTLIGQHPSNNGRLGPQPKTTLVGVLQDAADGDVGMLYEARDSLAVKYRNRLSIYNQAPTLQLTATTNLSLQHLNPNDDDMLLRNDVTVSRPTGSTAHYTIPDGDFFHLTTETPPSGVGTYDGSVSSNLETDGQLDQMAAWLAYLGSTKEPRYGEIALELHRTPFSGALGTSAAAVDIGHMITLAGQPSWCPPDPVEWLVHGYTEVMDKFTRTLRFKVSPYRPWEVWQLDTGGSTIAVAATSGATSWKLATSSGDAWSTTHEPYHLQATGEAVTVTVMTTDTPVFIAAGTAAHAVNASVSPALPAGITADVGQLLLVWAAIRNSGTGTVDLPSGWTNIVNFGNTRLMGRYYVTGDTAPTITFSGGAANQDTSAQMCAFSGLSMHLASAATDGASSTPAAVTSLNGSAQDIAFTPKTYVNRDGCVAFILAWKQDDWTSVATPASMDAEIGEPDTITGDDQGIAWYYDIQTTATDVAAGSLVVTGGASAISRSIVLALRPLQTATVTRSVNGVSTAQAAGAAVHGWRLGLMAL